MFKKFLKAIAVSLVVVMADDDRARVYPAAWYGGYRIKLL